MSKFKAVTKYLFFIAVFTAVALMASSAATAFAIYKTRPERSTAAIWGLGGRTRYAHVAVYAKGARASGTASPLAYVDDGSSLSVSDVSSIRASLQGIVDQAARSAKKSAKKTDKAIVPDAWTDCYSSCLKGQVNSGSLGTGDVYELDVYAVGGSFENMHPFEFMSGGFLTSDTTDGYQVVLNDAAAWSMFRSYDVIGKRIGLLGNDYTITGVVREHEDKDARVYVSFDRLEEYCNGLENPVIPAVMSYEAIFPEHASGSARVDLSGAIPGYNVSSPSFRVVRVTGRYNVFNALKTQAPHDFELPYWEECAIKAEADVKTCAIVFILGLVLLTGTAIGKISSS